MGPMHNSSPDQIVARKWIPVNETKLEVNSSKITIRLLFSKRPSYLIINYVR